MHNALSQFRDAIQAAGLVPPDVIEADGKLRRFASNGKRGDDAGFYVLHADGIPAGSFGDWRTGFSQTWRADIGRKPTPAEDAAHGAKLETMRRERDAERARQGAEAAKKAAAIWKDGTLASADHPYLLRKHVPPVATLREIDASVAAAILGYVPKSNGNALAGRLLAAPVKIGVKLSTCELIDEAGRKSAIYGGAKSGGYWAAQPLPEGDGPEPLQIGEGVATVLSAKQASGHLSIAALSAGNLPAVAKSMRERYPTRPLIFLADLVKATGEPNPHAIEAAQSVGGRVAAPDFGADRPEGATDFNDLHQSHGLDAVKRAIAGAAAPKKADTQPHAGRAQNEHCALTVNLIRGSDVTPEPVTWLWNGWLAAGKMHVLGGAPGTGKTTISMALASTVTIGGGWPDGSRSPMGNVVIWSGEDDPADTLIPRLSLSGADLSRVYFIADVREGNDRRSFDPARDMEVLRRKLAEIGDVRLLIVDPIVSAIAGDSHKNAEVRRGLQPLADLAASMRCALLGITHFSKGTGGRDPVERLTGSLAFGALARVVLVAAKQQEEGEDGRTVRLFIRAKSNIGPDDGGFEYNLHQSEMKTHPGIFSSSVLWGDPVEGAARELLATADATGDDGEGGTLTDAKSFLVEILGNGPMPAKAIKADAEGAGYSWATIKRAKKALGVMPYKSGMKSGWEWGLPPKVLKIPEDAQQKEVSTFANSEHLRTDPDTVEVEI